MKRVMRRLLQSPLFNNPIYKWAYWRRVRKMIPKLLPKPTRIIIENTNLCNLACDYCCHPKMKRERGIMDMELFKHIVDEAFEWKIPYIYLFGIGEPLIDTKYADKVKYAADRIENVHCITNGILLNPELMRELVRARLTYLGVSINEVLPKYISVWKEIRDSMMSTKPFIDFKLKDNFKHMAGKFKRYADRVEYFVNLTSWGNVFKGNVPEGIKFPCKDLWTTLMVHWDGWVALCCKDYEQDYILGDMNRDTLKQIWNSQDLMWMRNAHLRKDYHYPCGICDSNSHLVTPWW